MDHVTATGRPSLEPRSHQAGGASLLERYLTVRNASRELTAALTPEDCVIQTMPDVSPTKWHLAHTTWFFETFLVSEWVPDYHPARPEFRYLFNSYYNTIGKQFPRARRGTISRPSLDEVWAYRQEVDDQMTKLLDNAQLCGNSRFAEVVEVGLNHEQQHQELMLTDIKHVFWSNPLRPAYASDGTPAAQAGNHAAPFQWLDEPGGLRWVGHDGTGFCYDNELPRHQVFVPPFRLASRLVTNREYLAFMQDDGYRRPELWLSDGWDALHDQQWQAPLYWELQGDEWWQFTLAGMRPLALDEPVCHVSYFEADAFARWSDARLPTEAEWETAAIGNLPRHTDPNTTFRPRPAPANDADALLQVDRDVW